MTTGRSATLVRRWVALYTHGLPVDVRDARREEIAADLWSQAHDAARVDPSAPADDVLGRLLFGLWADITWRLEHGRRVRGRPVQRSLSTGTRIIAALAIVGGTGFAVMMVIFAGVLMAAPDTTFETLDWGSPEVTVSLTVGMGAIALLSIALWGLVFRFQDQVRGGVALVGVTGGFGGMLEAIGAYGLAALLPIGSTVVVWDLSRFGALPRSLSITHALGAVLFLVLIFLGDNGPRNVPWIVLGLVYPLSWIAIGVVLLRGQPVVDHPVMSVEAPR